MDPSIAIICVLVGYLSGSLSFSRIFMRILAPGKDIANIQIEIKGSGERVTSKIYGANTASMVLGKGAGISIALCDLLKVAIPMLGFKLLYPADPYFLLVSVAGLAGHNWPIFHGFRGGVGLAVLLGSLLIIDAPGVIFMIAVSTLMGIAIFRNILVGDVLWLILMIPWLYFRTGDVAYLYYAVTVTAIFFLATIPESREVIRLRKEGKFDAYQAGISEASSRFRGIKKISDFVSKGWRRLFFAAISLVALICGFLVIMV
uniref:Glycerol-3-phosphate acyltransferase n=1 Tax=Candidatus Methanomethylicus mesodigestus TaxID=1867258 RepID=A0A7C3EZP1_9CREN